MIRLQVPLNLIFLKKYILSVQSFGNKLNLHQSESNVRFPVIYVKMKVRL